MIYAEQWAKEHGLQMGEGEKFPEGTWLEMYGNYLRESMMKPRRLHVCDVEWMVWVSQTAAQKSSVKGKVEACKMAVHAAGVGFDDEIKLTGLH